jgi:hypothetical protein
MRKARLRAMIRLKLKAGLLPRQPSGRLWAGSGDNEVCSVCDEEITKKQILYEWECNGGKVQMHIGCYEVWNDLRSH